LKFAVKKLGGASLLMVTLTRTSRREPSDAVVRQLPLEIVEGPAKLLSETDVIEGVEASLLPEIWKLGCTGYCADAKFEALVTPT
jgi:hypothetical protein